MLQLTISHIGPIQDITLNLNRFNVLIGPQSSGKSTIAKIISFCLWLEKDILLQRTNSYIDRAFIDKQLLEFHKLKNYLNEGYYISFHGEIIRFTYSKELCNVEINKGFEQCKIGKIAYIPAERNAITLPNIASLKMPENNTRNFIFDWLEIHNKFQKRNAIDLLKLKLKYYYEESSQKDIVILENGKEILLEEASSGLQSVVPLYVYMYYLTHWVYEHQEDISFNKEEKIKHIIAQELLHSLKNKKSEPDEYFDSIIKIQSALKENLLYPHYSNIILEEPELNLFPETQKELIYDMIEMFNESRDRIVMTTHSPYLLYALNNCMLCHLAQNNIPQEDTDLFLLKKSMIDPANVSVWELKNGTFAAYKENPNHTIQDEKGLIRNNYFDRIMKNIMADFSSLIDYCDED